MYKVYLYIKYTAQQWKSLKNIFMQLAKQSSLDFRQKRRDKRFRAMATNWYEVSEYIYICRV